MKHIFYTIIFTIIQLLAVFGQSTYTKTVIDNETGKPIANAHIYKTLDLQTGTITNEDGLFVLRNIKSTDIIEVSHIAYNTFKGKVKEIKSDTIRLQRKYNIIAEISVETGQTLMNKVIENLYDNHFVEPVMYEVFVRVAQLEQDSSELHVFSEYAMNFYYNKNSKPRIKVLKVRAKPISETGKKYFKDMRIINAISTSSDNIFRFQEDIFKKKKLKYYTITIDENSDDINCTKINLIDKKDKTKYTLLVDNQSYAISKFISYYESGGIKELGFKKIKDKWYLDYSKRLRNAQVFAKWKHNSKAISDIIAIYNVKNDVKYYPKQFKTEINIIAEPIKYHIGDWTQQYWDNHNFIPISKWINKQLVKK